MCRQLYGAITMNPYISRMEHITEVFGFAALFVTTLGLCLRSDQALRVLNLTGVVLWILHFGFLGAIVACGMLCLAGVMIASSIRGWRRVGFLALWANIILVPVVGVLLILGQVGLDALAPIVGGLLINVGISRCKGHTMSAMIAGGEIIWVLAGLLIGSVPAVIANLVNLFALGVRTSWVLCVNHKVCEKISIDI